MRESQGRMCLGALAILLGLLWFLNNIGLTQTDIGRLISVYWPVIFILFGTELIIRDTTCRSQEESRSADIRSAVLNGAILIVIGALILGSNLGIYRLDLSVIWRVFWPVVLILIGWSLLRGTTTTGGTHWAIMSGIELRNKGWRLESGNMIAFMGGINLDLTVAEIPEKDTVLNLTAIMGGINVRVPDNINVECDGTAILGGVRFFNERAGGLISSRRFSGKEVDTSKKRVIIYSRAIMGGIEIKR
ncbi:MAG TPA: cell wall-active antibiotics response protein LiaF [Bacillota bacterium]|nr:cell wall-active antibiotics response protein LiaF [Bacillota bacterium]